ncbi:hypothetical protein F4776DRAFT_675853 [Hypoxylon sp. NC0597]|nr:hypothetical protein F4776DRAFT_675853 [Hypoxylon sp. NC0597]
MPIMAPNTAPNTAPRKEQWEYSKNKNTVRARQRQAALSPYRREVEHAKAADLKSINRAWKIHANTNTYKAATEEEREMILEDVKREVMEKRVKKGIDARSKEQLFIARQQASNNGPSGPLTTDALATLSTAASVSAGAGAGAGTALSSGVAPFPAAGYGVGTLSTYHVPSMNISQSTYLNGLDTTSEYSSAAAAATTHSSQSGAPQQTLAEETFDDYQLAPAALNDNLRVQALESEVAFLNQKLIAAEQKIDTLEARVEFMARVVGMGPGVGSAASDIKVLADTAAKVAQQLSGSGMMTTEQSSQTAAGYEDYNFLRDLESNVGDGVEDFMSSAHGDA